MCRLGSGSRLCSLTILPPWFLSLAIRRQLCLLLNAENIFHSMADILLREEDLKFASTMVHTLNTILLTSSELFQLRNQLKDLKTPVWAVGAGSAAGGMPGEVSCCLVPAWQVPGLELGRLGWPLHSSSLQGCLEDVPNSCFSPPGWDQAPRAAATSLPPPQHGPGDR